MIKFSILSIVAASTLLMALGGVTGIFGGVALLAVSVAGFGLLVNLCTELTREN